MPVSFKEYVQMKAALGAGEIDEATMLDRFKSGVKAIVKTVGGKDDEAEETDVKSLKGKPVIKRDAEFEKRKAEFEARRAKRPVGTIGTHIGSARSNAHDRTGDVFGFGKKVNSSQELDLDGEHLSEAKQEFEVGYIRADNNSRGRTRISASNAKAARARFMKLHIGMRVIWVKPASTNVAREAEDLTIEMDDDDLDAPIETKSRR